MTDILNHKFPGVFNVRDNERTSLSTKSLVPRQSVYGEKIVKKDSEEYRLWATRRSKLAAAIKKGLREMPIQPGSRVLYLGASSGTTVSHVSDIVGENGIVFAVEFSVQVARKLIRLAETRTNIVPIIGDARHPARYAPLVGGSVDIVYQDVAQPNQAGILLENLSAFCSLGGYGMIAIKARSIDSTSGTDEVYNKEIAQLAAGGAEVIDNVNLDPLEKDHRFIVVRLAEEPV
ncbi:MAG: fibrillarin-like rRNA/tRNA 2'-O-methyltransferase [Candidatus Thorarchaeota archaeon]|jgi:fibrillarin-like pre-rRNA processing protein